MFPLEENHEWNPGSIQDLFISQRRRDGVASQEFDGTLLD